MTDNIIDIIGDCVKRVEVELLPGLVKLKRSISNINYLYGPIKEVNERLVEWTTSGMLQKYPLVALIMPFSELRGNELKIDGTFTDMRILICMITDVATTDVRIQKNFIPILRPVYTELIAQLAGDSRIVGTYPETFEHKKTEWPFWDDGSGKNIFSDKLDIIEIKGLKLKTYTNYC